MSFLRAYCTAWAISLYNKYRSVERKDTIQFYLAFAAVLVYWIAGYIILYSGIRYVVYAYDFGPLILNRSLYLFTFSLFVFLFISTVVTAESIFFKSPDIPGIFTLPASKKMILSIKCLETGFYSTLPFVLFCLPFAAALVTLNKIGFLHILVVCSVFALMAAAAVVWGLVVFIILRCLCAVNAKKVVLTVWVVGLLVVYKKARSAYTGLDMFSEKDIMSGVMSFFRGIDVLFSPRLPTAWWADMMTHSLVKDLSGLWKEYLMSAIVIVAGLLCVYLFMFAMKNALLRGTKKGTTSAFLRGVTPKSMFSMYLIKDIKTFFRDSQMLLNFIFFFGFIALYFFNLRIFSYQEKRLYWCSVRLITNFFTVTLVLATFAVRFYFPQPALEARRRWLTFFSSVTWQKGLEYKFVFCVVLTGITAAVLTCVSNLMLDAPFMLHIIGQIYGLGAALLLSSLALTMGTVFADTRHEDMARIVNSMGGVVALTICLGAVFLTVVLYGLPLYLYWGKASITAGQFYLLQGLCLVLYAAACAAGIRLFKKTIYTTEIVIVT